MQRLYENFGLSHQDVRDVGKLVAAFHETLRRFPHRPSPLAHSGGQHRAGIDMRANAFDEIMITERTDMGTAVDEHRQEVGQAIGARARGTAGDRVAPAVGGEHQALLGTERARPTAVEMGQTAMVEGHGVFR